MNSYTNIHSLITAGFVAISLLISPFSTASAQQYQIIDLGINITPNDINDAKVVVVTRANADYTKTALTYDVVHGVFTEISGGNLANAINNTNQVAGNTCTGAYLYSDNYFQDLGTYYTANGINDDRLIAGSKSSTNPYRSVPRPVNPAIYDIDKSLWIELDVARVYPRGTLEGVYADLFTLVDINENGYAVGNYRKYGLTTASGFLVTPAFDQVIRLVYSSSNAINNNNLIVGRAVFDALLDPNAHAYVYAYDTGQLNDLGTLNSGLTSEAMDINDQNQVVGMSLTWPYLSSLSDPDKYHAFIWQEGQMYDLNALISQDSGWTLNIAYALNNNGDIVGTGWFDGQLHGFVLVTEASDPVEDPVPEPEAESLLPVAVASAEPLYGRAPLTVSFDGANSFDPDGDIVEYKWEFETGEFSYEAQPQYTFTSIGKYPVTLTVSDDDGMTSQAVLTIRVKRK